MRISDWSSDVFSSDLLLLLSLPMARTGTTMAPPVSKGAASPASSATPADARSRLVEIIRTLPMLCRHGAGGGWLSSRNRDRKSVVQGKSVYGRVDLGGLRNITKKTNTYTTHNN